MQDRRRRETRLLKRIAGPLDVIVSVPESGADRRRLRLFFRCAVRIARVRLKRPVTHQFRLNVFATKRLLRSLHDIVQARRGRTTSLDSEDPAPSRCERATAPPFAGPSGPSLGTLRNMRLPIYH